MATNVDTAKTFIKAATNIVQALGEANPREDEFDDLLLKHERLCRTALQYMDLQERIGFFLGEMGEIEKEIQPEDSTPTIVPIRPAPSVEKVDEPVAEEHPVEQPFPAAVPKAEEPKPVAPSVTLDEVKTAFTTAARSGVKVADIIHDAGYAKLSDVPPDKYADLMAALAEVTA
jgi:hypothetical protein